MFKSLADDESDITPPKKKIKSVAFSPYEYSEGIVFERLPCIKMEPEQEEFSDRASTPLELESEEIHVDVVAGAAKITTVMTFFNSTSKTLAGELVFPLPKDTSIHGYGLDINGVMVDAVPVPKETARIAFETTVREHGPEISIAESVDAMTNSFKTRVYPMHSKGRRTVKVVVLSKLIEDEKNQLFFLNMQKPASLKNFKFTINAPQDTQVMVRRVSGQMELANPDKLKATDDFEGILLVTPKESKNVEVFCEKDPDSGYTYFSATFSGLRCETKEIDGIKKATVFFDVSSSRRFCEFKEELKLLKTLMTENKDIEIDFKPFSNVCHASEAKVFKKFEELAKYVTEIKWDGGTSIPFEQISDTEDSQIILMFTDGISNYGGQIEAELKKMKFNAPIYCISSSPTSSYILLRYLGSKSGGGFYDCSEESVESICGKIGRDQFGVRNLIYNSKEISEVFNGEIINNAVSVYGRILVDTSSIEVDFGNKNVLKTEIDVSKKLLKNSTIIRTLWAQQKIQSLTIFKDQHKNEITQLGMEYGIVTENTSLIVLSDISQYQKYKIMPPKSLKDVRKQYMNTIFENEKNEETRIKAKLESVIEKWNRRIEWHKKDFEPVEEPIFEEKKKSEEMLCERMCSLSSCVTGACFDASCYSCVENCFHCPEDFFAPAALFKKAKGKKKKKKMKKKCEIKKDKKKMMPKKMKPKPKPKPKPPKPSSSASINVKAFVPGSAYLDSISNASNKYEEYLKQKVQSYEESPSFYLDVADYFITVTKSIDIGVRVLSNIAELELNNIQLLRIMGYRLDQAEKYEEAIQFFEKVLKLKPEEPQSYRDLALVFEKTGDFEKAATLFYKVITMEVEQRFDEIELTAAIELNHVLQQIKDPGKREELIKKLNIDLRLIYVMDCDIRISMAWDTDSTDIDLHVYDPDSEHCYYSHKDTKAGGFISRDFVRGYGPEEFMQKKVHKNGKFRITAKYFASHQQSLTGGTTILCTFFTHYLKSQEKRALVTLRLTSNKQEVEVCEIDFKVVK